MKSQLSDQNLLSKSAVNHVIYRLKHDPPSSSPPKKRPALIGLRQAPNQLVHFYELILHNLHLELGAHSNHYTWGIHTDGMVWHGTLSICCLQV